VPCGPRSTSTCSTSKVDAIMPMPLKSISSTRKPMDGFGAPWYCSSSPMPRSWK
jgi:hypothetical protein